MAVHLFGRKRKENNKLLIADEDAMIVDKVNNNNKPLTQIFQQQLPKRLSVFLCPALLV